MDMSTQLYKETNYFSGINFLTSSFIREYDLSKANISSLLYKGVIDKAQYDTFYNMSKLSREITIGNMERNDNRISELKKEGITEARKLLCETNNLEDTDILEIRNDAVFVINKELSNTNFGIFDFKMKNLYNIFVFINKQLSIYYRFDTIGGVDMIDIKGINDSILELHRDYFIKFLCDTFYKLQCESIESTIDYITRFIEDYIHLNLDINFYREFNSSSLFRVKTTRLNYMNYGLYEMEDNIQNKNALDINTNLAIARTIYGYISQLYFSTRR